MSQNVPNRLVLLSGTLTKAKRESFELSGLENGSKPRV